MQVYVGLTVMLGKKNFPVLGILLCHDRIIAVMPDGLCIEASEGYSGLSMATYAMQTTFVCKLWKLQYGPLDQDPRGMRRGGNFTINHPPLN